MQVHYPRCLKCPQCADGPCPETTDHPYFWAGPFCDGVSFEGILTYFPVGSGVWAATFTEPNPFPPDANVTLQVIMYCNLTSGGWQFNSFIFTVSLGTPDPDNPFGANINQKFCGLGVPYTDPYRTGGKNWTEWANVPLSGNCCDVAGTVTMGVVWNHL